MERWESRLERQDFLVMTDYLKTMKTRLRLAVAFLALLELIRQGKVLIEDSAEGFVVKGGSV